MRSEEFQNAINHFKRLESFLPNSVLLVFYGLYQQATCGDNESSRPEMSDLKGIAKWDSWTKYKGMSKTDAEKEYIRFAGSLEAEE